MENTNINDIVLPILLNSPLIESFDRGIVLLSQEGQLFYLNQKAKKLCRKLGNRNEAFENLHSVINKIYKKLNKNRDFKNQPCVLEYQGNKLEKAFNYR